jgi:hypothetical protein
VNGTKLDTNEPKQIIDAVTAPLAEGEQKVNWLFRYRLESVDQAGFTENALASTLLSRVSVLNGLTEHLSGGVEFDYVSKIGDGYYNDSYNGKTQYQLIADPAGSDLNQAFLNY